MAAIDVRPIVPQQYDSFGQLNRALLAKQEIEQKKLAADAEAKRKQQEAVVRAIQNQKSANDRIYGDASKAARDYKEKSTSVPPERKAQKMNSFMDYLTKNHERPDFLALALDGLSKIQSEFEADNKYFADVDNAAKEAEKIGMNPDLVRAFGNHLLLKESKEGTDNSDIIRGIGMGIIDPKAGQTKQEAIEQAKSLGVKTVYQYRDPHEIGDVSRIINEEIVAHPELYFHEAKLSEAAYKQLGTITKDKNPKETKLSYDPTGLRLQSIGVKYDVDPFDVEVEKKDNLTGLTYKVPQLDVIQFKGPYSRPDGLPMQVLSEDKFKILYNNGGQVIQNKILSGALGKIRSHNEQVFRDAGVMNPEDLALSVSKNNADRFKDIPGFVNPFDDGAVEVFQRSYAVDFLKNSGRYSDDGSVKTVSIDRGVNANKPTGGSGGATGAAPVIDVVKEVADYWSSNPRDPKMPWVPITALSSSAQDAILNSARTKYSAANIDQPDVRIEKVDGKYAIVSAKDIRDKSTNKIIRKAGEYITSLDDAANIYANKPLGTKSVRQSVDQPNGKVISTSEFQKMSLSDRIKFRNEGGTVK